MSKMTNLLIFAVGAAVGSFVTWKFVKTKYKQIADEEIESVKETYRQDIRDMKASLEKLRDDADKMTPVEERPNPRTEKPVVTEYVKKYRDIVANNYTEEVDETNIHDRPYVIPPEEFGMADGYDIVSLNYYADGVLADDFDEVIEDVDAVVGEESLTHFGDFEDDSVHVRNDALKTEYEILLVLRNFSDVVNDSSDPEED